MVERSVEVKAPLHDRDQYVNGDRSPDLSLDCILTGAVKGLDPQVLFDPFEEQFNFPRDLYSSAIVNAGRSKLFVRKTSVRSCSES